VNVHCSATTGMIGRTSILVLDFLGIFASATNTPTEPEFDVEADTFLFSEGAVSIECAAFEGDTVRTDILVEGGSMADKSLVRDPASSGASSMTCCRGAKEDMISALKVVWADLMIRPSSRAAECLCVSLDLVAHTTTELVLTNDIDEMVEMEKRDASKSKDA
jgi:hypothetical protein